MRCSTLTRRSGFFARLTAIALAVSCIGFAPAISSAATTTHPTTTHKTTAKKTSKPKGTLRERINRRLQAMSKKKNSKPPKKTSQAQARATKTQHHSRAKSTRKPHTTGRTV